MSYLDAVVYRPDATTKIAKIVNPLALDALEEYDGVGGGTLTLPASDPQLTAHPDLLDERNIVKVRIDGQPVAAWMITTRDDTVVAAGGDGARKVVVSGPSIDAWPADAVVYAERQQPHSAGTRWFSWGSAAGDWYNPAQWGIPSICRERTPIAWADATNPWRKAPENWPASSTPAAWIWDRSSAWQSAPAGDCYFRHEFTATTDARYRLYITADNAAQVILDGEPVAIVKDPDAWMRAYSVDLDAPAGDHVLGIKARNLDGPAGLLAELHQVAADDTTTRLAWTGGPGWTVCSYPATEPGWTFGGVLIALIDEARARGVTTLGRLAGYSFTATTDTAGRPWAVQPYRLSVGDSVAKFIDAQRDVGIRVHIDPATLILHAWNGRPAAKPSVALDAAINVETLAEKREAAQATALLIATGEQWAGAATPSRHGRIEAYLNVSGMPAAHAALLSRAVLDKSSTPTDSVTVKYTPTGQDIPWQHLQVGDPVRVSSSRGPISRLVVGLGVTLAADGAPVYEIELDTAARDLDERLARIVARSGADEGTVAGRVAASRQDPSGGADGGGIGYLPNTELDESNWPGTDPADPANAPTDPDTPVPGGWVDEDGVRRDPPDTVHGWFDEDGKWHEGSAGGWYDADGNLHTGHPAGWYDTGGTWREGATGDDGYFDAAGRWHEGPVSGWVGGDGNTHTGSPSGWYDNEGRWHEGSVGGWHDDQGVWHPDTPDGSYDPETGAWHEYDPDDATNPGIPGDPGDTGPGASYLPTGGTPGPWTGAGGDPAWSGIDTPGGFGPLGPVLTDPAGPDPWALPADPTGDTEGAFDVGQVSAQVAEDAIAVVTGYAPALAVALLRSEPPRPGGIWDAIEPYEVDGEGYARLEIAWDQFGEATGLNPVHRDLLTEVSMNVNPGPEPWDTAAFVAIIVGTAVRSVIPLATPITVGKDQVFTIPAGGLQLTAASVGSS